MKGNMKKNGDKYMDSRRACADKWDRLLNWSEIQSDAQQTNAAKKYFQCNQKRFSLYHPGDVQINWCLVGSKKPSPSGSAAFSISKAIEQRNAGYWRRG